MLIVLGMLLALLGPFLISMSTQGAAADQEAADRDVETQVITARDVALQRVSRVQGGRDDSPSHDGVDEFLAGVALRDPNQKGEQPPSPLGPRRVQSVETEDLQGRIHAPTASPHVWANLLGLGTLLTTKLAATEEDVIAAGGIERFDDEGYLWVEHELVHYARKTDRGFEGLTRGLRATDPTLPPDPFGVKADHEVGTVVLDARVVALALRQFDADGQPGGEDRCGNFVPWRGLGELARIASWEVGTLSPERLEPLRPLLAFDAARPNGAALGRAERVFNSITPGQTSVLEVRDAASFPAGTLLRVRVKDAWQWALVVAHGDRGQRQTSADLSPLWRLDLHRPLHLTAEEGEAIAEPLCPVPVNVNTASAEVLAAISQGVMERPRIATRGHTNLRTPLSSSKARSVAERIVAQRLPVDHLGPHRPYPGFDDLMERVIKPMVEEEGLLTRQEFFYLYSQWVNGSQARLDHAGIPLCFESAGLVGYRAAAAYLSGAGQTLGRRERRGVALVQPSGVVDRIYANQVDLDEATRLGRGRPWWCTWPLNTTMRTGSESGEPPDLSVPHLLPWLHNKPAQFPSRDPEGSRATLAIARPTNFGQLNATYGFETEVHPEGWSTKQNGPFRDVIAFLPGAPRSVDGLKTQVKEMADKKVIPMSTGAEGFGMPFGLSAWFKPNTVGADQVLFELANKDGAPAQNRISAAIEGGELVLRVYDMAGFDPQPNDGSPRDTSLRWRLPIAGNAIADDLWFHLAFEICGGEPSSLVMFTDGAAKGKPDHMSWLVGDIPTFSPNQPRLVGNEKGWTPTLGVEDGKDLPRAGTFIVGGELFEVTDITGNGLVTQRKDSRGGRGARVDFFELQRGQQGGGQGGGGNQTQVEFPAHPANSGLRLYGYQNAVLQDAVVPLGESRLPAELRPWGCARAVNGSKSITVGMVTLGKGIEEGFTGKLDLVPPVVGGKADPNGMPGFERGGGYALLVQTHINVSNTNANLFDQAGGVEAVRYSGFDGQSVNIEARGVKLPPDLNGTPQGVIANAPRKFVTEWEKGFGGSRVDLNDMPQMWCWLVPISMAVSGSFRPIDPSPRGHSEWLQVYPPGKEADTEWVRYDHVDEGRGWVVRTRSAAVERLYFVLAQGDTDIEISGRPPVISIRIDNDSAKTFATPPEIDPSEIGHPDDFETGQNLPHYEARVRFGFRGDASVGTSAHLQGPNSVVTPAFRTVLFERDVRPGRPGRNDRVALVTRATDGAPPNVEWNEVNWAARNWEIFDPTQIGNQQPGRDDPRGPRANLVALKQGATVPLIGGELVDDVRLLDRIVKFPSGELPQRLNPQPVLGGSDTQTGAFQGILDDVQGYWGLSLDVRGAGLDSQIVGIVAVPIREGDKDWQLAPSQRHGQANPAVLDGGGLVLVEGEIVGFTRFDQGTGRLTVAENGRGMLGTTPRAHDIGARVQLVSCRPATALSSGMNVNSIALLVNKPEKLGQAPGTVLVGQELVHFTWTRGQMLEMPAHLGEVGLLRGRYGTTPAAHQAEEIAISWPIRYWDRYTERADDPEVAYFQVSAEAPNLYVTELVWEEELPESGLDLIVLARADERVPWSADPATTFGVWRFDDPKDKDGRLGRRIGAQASRWDFRVHALYKPGCFDPVSYVGTAWKRTPVLKSLAWAYESATSVVCEERTLR